MSKELWFREFERLYSEKLDAGIPDRLAYGQAGNEAHGALAERLADRADRERKRRKEEGWPDWLQDAAKSIDTLCK